MKAHEKIEINPNLARMVELVAVGGMKAPDAYLIAYENSKQNVFKTGYAYQLLHRPEAKAYREALLNGLRAYLPAVKQRILK